MQTLDTLPSAVIAKGRDKLRAIRMRQRQGAPLTTAFPTPEPPRYRRLSPATLASVLADLEQMPRQRVKAAWDDGSVKAPELRTVDDLMATDTRRMLSRTERLEHAED